MEPAKRSAPANANGTAKAAGPAKAVSAKKVTGTAKASTSAKATAATKKATAKAPGAAKKAAGAAEKAAGTAKKASGTAKKATKQAGSGEGRSSRRDLSGLIADVRAALDGVPKKGDTATKQGRERVKDQVAHVEDLWSRVRHEVGVSRNEGDAAVENIRAALGKAEETVTHMIDVAL